MKYPSFLFRFDLRGDGIDFVLNEAIAADMYQDVDEKMRPLVHACCETLLRYKHLSVSNTIMDGNILAAGGFEVMLSKGLGGHFAPDEKARLFQDAKTIHDLLAAVMDRRTQDPKKGKNRKSAPIKSPPSPKKINKGLEELGKQNACRTDHGGLRREGRSGQEYGSCALMNYLLMSLYQADMTIEGNVMFLDIKNTVIWENSY
jgi:hypothetical protein